MDEENKNNIDKLNKTTMEKGKEEYEKAKKIKNIKTTLIIAVAKAISVVILIGIGFGVLAILAGAVNLNDLDRNSKASTAKEKAIGNEALDTILTMEDGKYKISYDEKNGREAIKAILEDADMNFEDFNDEEIECIYKCLKAEWATTYPNLGQDVDNKDTNSDYVQGVITIKRGKSDGSIETLEYKPYEEFTNIKDESALKYFSMKDGAIVVAGWSSIQTEYKLEKTERSTKDIPEDIKNQYVGTEEQISISETVINYRNMIGVHGMPFEFLLALLVNTEDIQFVNDLAELAFNSTIEITVYDNTVVIISDNTELNTEKTTYVKEADWYRYKTTEKTNSEGEYIGGYTSIDASGHEEFDSENIDILEYNITTTITTKNNSYVVGLTKVDSWIGKLENTYIHSTSSKVEDYGEGEPFSQTVKYDPENISTTDTELQAILNNKRKSNSKYTDEEGITYEITYKNELRNAKMTASLETIKKITKNTNTTNEYKYENTSKSTSDIGKKFKEVYDKNKKAQAQMNNVASWLFELLEETEASIDYVSIMKYLLYLCTGEDYGVTEIDLDLFKQDSFTYVGTIQGENALHAFLLAWESTKKDSSGNFILHRPNDVTIGYGLYLKYNLDLFQKLGYFEDLNQSVWENELYEIRRQRVVNKEDLKFYNYGIENGNLVRKEKIPNEVIEQASTDSRNKFRESVEKEVTHQLTSNQYDALTVIKYKWGNIGNFNSVYKYYEDGDKDKFLSEFYVSGTHPMKKEKDFSERQYAAWIMFDQGIYLDRSGNQIALPNVETSETRTFLEVAKERHDYINNNNYTYVNGTTIPADASRNRGIDCSAYVSDVIYWYGYYNGYQKYVDTFKGWQHVSSWFMSKSNVESMGWKQLDISQVQAGDLIVKSGHIEIYAGDGKCYNAGSTEAINKEYSNSGMTYVKGFTYAIRIIPPSTGGSTVNKGNYKEVKNGREIAEYARNQKFYQGANRSKWGDSCLGFSIVYGTAIKNNDKSLITRNKSQLTENSPVGTNWPKEITNNSKQAVLANVYDQINRGNPCIIQVNGNTQGTSRHYVVVIGYKTSVTSRDTIKETDLLIVDVWDAQVEEVGYKGSGKRFMISGWDTGRTGENGYGYQMYILN